MDKDTAKALKQAQQQLIVEQQRCADLLEQSEMIAQRAQQEESFHREQVEKLLARLEAAESLEAANKPSQPAAAEQPPLTDPQTTVLKYAELEQQLEQLKQVSAMSYRIVAKLAGFQVSPQATPQVFHLSQGDYRAIIDEAAAC